MWRSKPLPSCRWELSVKALTPDEVASTRRIILANTYHLWLRPGAESIASHGGVVGFMNWPHALLGPTAAAIRFSSAQHRTVDDDGITFRSHLDGSLHRWKRCAVQALLGSGHRHGARRVSPRGCATSRSRTCNGGAGCGAACKRAARGTEARPGIGCRIWRQSPPSTSTAWRLGAFRLASQRRACLSIASLRRCPNTDPAISWVLHVYRFARSDSRLGWTFLIASFRPATPATAMLHPGEAGSV